MLITLTLADPIPSHTQGFTARCQDIKATLGTEWVSLCDSHKNFFAIERILQSKPLIL